MIICPECKRIFLSLGFPRHRTAHWERRKGLIKRPMPKGGILNRATDKAKQKGGGQLK